MHDAFVVKYDAGVPMPSARSHAAKTAATPAVPAAPSSEEARGQTYLPLHCDQSSHSFTIALNANDEYEGGGTYFPALNHVFRPGMITPHVILSINDHSCENSYVVLL